MDITVNGEPVPETSGGRAVDPELGAALHEIERLKAKIARYEHGITWETTCERCATLLDSAYTETVRAETAEARAASLLALFEPVSHGVRVAVVSAGVLAEIAAGGPERNPGAAGDSGTADGMATAGAAQ